MSHENKMLACFLVLVAALCVIVRGVAMYSRPLGWIFAGAFVALFTVCIAYDLLDQEKRRRR